MVGQNTVHNGQRQLSTLGALRRVSWKSRSSAGTSIISAVAAHHHAVQPLVRQQQKQQQQHRMHAACGPNSARHATPAAGVSPRQSLAARAVVSCNARQQPATAAAKTISQGPTVLLSDAQLRVTYQPIHGANSCFNLLLDIPQQLKCCCTALPAGNGFQLLQDPQASFCNGFQPLRFGDACYLAANTAVLQAEGITVDSASAVTAADVGSAAAGQPDDSSFVLLRLKSRHLAHASAAADNAHRQQQQQHAQQEYQQQDGQGFQQEHAMIAVAQVQQAASTGFEQGPWSWFSADAGRDAQTAADATDASSDDAADTSQDIFCGAPVDARQLIDGVWYVKSSSSGTAANECWRKMAEAEQMLVAGAPGELPDERHMLTKVFQTASTGYCSLLLLVKAGAITTAWSKAASRIDAGIPTPQGPGVYCYLAQPPQQPMQHTVSAESAAAAQPEGGKGPESAAAAAVWIPVYMDYSSNLLQRFKRYLATDSNRTPSALWLGDRSSPAKYAAMLELQLKGFSIAVAFHQVSDSRTARHKEAQLLHSYNCPLNAVHNGGLRAVMVPQLPGDNITQCTEASTGDSGTGWHSQSGRLNRLQLVPIGEYQEHPVGCLLTPQMLRLLQQERRKALGFGDAASAAG